MKKIKIYLIGAYIVIATILAFPQAQFLWYEATKEEDSTQALQAGLSDDQWEFLKDYYKLLQYADDLGYKVTAGELYRTKYQQRRYIQQGLSWTMNSYHLKRKAGDLNLFINNKYITNCEGYDILGDYWESLSPSNRWGGRFGDCPHFERRD